MCQGSGSIEIAVRQFNRLLILRNGFQWFSRTFIADSELTSTSASSLADGLPCVFLDTDNSINGAVRKIRQVLKDDPERSRFVQTVTGKGYRFIAPAGGEQKGAGNRGQTSEGGGA